MKALRSAILLLFVAATAVPQTLSLGQGIFYNSEGAILIAVDAGVAIRKINSPYVMFRAFMAATGGEDIAVDRADVVMIYKDAEYRMPVYKEFQKAYSARQSDLNMYRNLGKESLALSPMRNFRFPSSSDFFPVFGETSARLTNEGSMAGNIGFMTTLYFKNPGFKKGDTLVIKVSDKKRPELMGAVAVVLE
jgi:hypothetical protein